MNRHRIAAFTVAAIVGLGGATALGQGSGREQTPSQQAATLADALRVGGIDSPARGLASFVRIVGFVWTEGDHPVLYPRLVIRDLTNGQVVDETTGSEAGGSPGPPRVAAPPNTRRLLSPWSGLTVCWRSVRR
jgi:hypothetical protein